MPVKKLLAIISIALILGTTAPPKPQPQNAKQTSQWPETAVEYGGAVAILAVSC